MITYTFSEICERSGLPEETIIRLFKQGRLRIVESDFIDLLTLVSVSESEHLRKREKLYIEQ